MTDKKVSDKVDKALVNVRAADTQVTYTADKGAEAETRMVDTVDNLDKKMMDKADEADKGVTDNEMVDEVNNTDTKTEADMKMAETLENVDKEMVYEVEEADEIDNETDSKTKN